MYHENISRNCEQNGVLWIRALRSSHKTVCLLIKQFQRRRRSTEKPGVFYYDQLFDDSHQLRNPLTVGLYLAIHGLFYLFIFKILVK